MAVTRSTMTDEQRSSVALEYLKAFDSGGVTSTGGSIMDLFAEDAQVWFAKWGLAGEGAWITVYANAGHAYAVVAGLRWDTSGGKGPRWHEDMRSPDGYKARHWEGL